MREISLIGSTGFLGKTLKEYYQFTNFFDSKNIQTIGNYKHDTIYCCAPSAEKWKANLEPENDLKSIEKLIKSLCLLNKDVKFILFSTIDVYGENLSNVDESTLPIQTTNKYGYHRYLLEQFISKTFKNHYIIRLSGLFGIYMKKNIIFDILNDNFKTPLRLRDSFQWFAVKHIPQIIKFIEHKNIRLINVTSQPITNRKLSRLFDFINEVDEEHKLIEYDVKSIHFENNYFQNENAILLELKEFINEYSYFKYRME